MARQQAALDVDDMGESAAAAEALIKAAEELAEGTRAHDDEMRALEAEVPAPRVFGERPAG